jgi:hypothetical protein
MTEAQARQFVPLYQALQGFDDRAVQVQITCLDLPSPARWTRSSRARNGGRASQSGGPAHQPTHGTRNSGGTCTFWMVSTTHRLPAGNVLPILRPWLTAKEVTHPRASSSEGYRTVAGCVSGIRCRSYVRYTWSAREDGAVIQAYRFALDPSPVQERMLRSHCGAQLFAYNWGLAPVKANLDPPRSRRVPPRENPRQPVRRCGPTLIPEGVSLGHVFTRFPNGIDCASSAEAGFPAK